MEIQRKTMHSGINRAVGQRELAKTEHRFDLSMESKMHGNSKENHAFEDQSGCGTMRIRKKLSIDSTSVWKAKCIEIQRKTLHLGINRVGGQREFAKTEHRFDLSMGSKM